MEKQGQEKGFRLRGALQALVATLAIAAAGVIGLAIAAPTPNIAITAHNLSKNGSGNVKADTETQICAFCHTPHAGSSSLTGPLWNRNSTNATYTRYTSSSMDALNILDGFTNQPAASSLLCLSCHDGMVAVGSVNVLNGKSQTIKLNNTDDYKMPPGSTGALTGFTRLLGTDLTNDHPISVTFNDALASMDGELTRMTSNNADARDKVTGNILGVRTSTFRPLLPLAPTGFAGTGQVQCATCHDPHITNEKFLRLSRYQIGTPTGAAFSESNDQICLACHPKLNKVWAESAHANPTTADEAYLDDAAVRRGFNKGTTVWKAACLNCHDTHTVQGARRLLREGVESGIGGTTAGSYRLGSAITPADTTSSIENTCYQCHDLSTSATRVIGTVAGSSVPDIRTEFSRLVRMPISTTEQLRNKREVHDIVDADFMESPELLGKNNPENRHVECTDCHNPHRVRRASTFYGTSSNLAGSEGSKRTHNAGGTTALKGADGNVASGVLRGTWGVQPLFGPTTSTWPQLPSTFDVKKGDAGFDTSTDRNKTYLTREYQLCFKCHSNYSNSDVFANFPPLGNTLGGTTGSPQQRNYLTRYTNVAAEFGSVRATDPPSTGTDQGEYGNDTLFTPNASPPGGGDKNHRSWHPVMWPTGRTNQERTNTDSFTNIKAPFNTQANIGYQTMHCSDCHGDPSGWTTGTGPNGNTQGPHGSSERFLLKGKWEPGSRYNTLSNYGFCGNCHDPKGGAGGFKTSEASHNGQYKRSAPCNFCHIAVPHGWKNKAFLVNLSCVGTEGGYAPGCTPVSGSNSNPYTNPPYYVGAILKVTTWQSSTQWDNEGNCFGGRSGMETNCGEWQ